MSVDEEEEDDDHDDDHSYAGRRTATLSLSEYSNGDNINSNICNDNGDDESSSV